MIFLYNVFSTLVCRFVCFALDHCAICPSSSIQGILTPSINFFLALRLDLLYDIKENICQCD